MATKSKFEGSVKLAQANGLVLENDPKDWGAAEHLNMLRYLVLACSDAAKAVVAEVEVEGKKVKCLALDGKPVKTITVDWASLKAEFTQSGKLAECANYKKWLADAHPQFKTSAERKNEYV